jgi:hypothetical protein
MFPCPLLLDTHFFLFPDTLSKPHQLKLHMSIYCFLHWNFAGLRKRKEHLIRTVGSGGKGKTLRQNISFHAVLRVPVPTALRNSFSSSSQLTHSRPHHLSLHIYILFCSLEQFSRSEKRKEHLRTVGMGGIRKTLRQMSVSNSRGKQTIVVLSSMFTFPLLLDILFLPLPGLPRPKTSRSLNCSTMQWYSLVYIGLV